MASIEFFSSIEELKAGRVETPVSNEERLRQEPALQALKLIKSKRLKCPENSDIQ